MTDDIDRRLYEKNTPLSDPPAFLRRARAVEDAWTALLDRCGSKREALLEMPRMRLARLFALAPPPSPLLASRLGPEKLVYLDGLFAQWQPRLRSAVRPAKSAADLARPLSDLARSFSRFNARWLAFVRELDLAPLNKLREDYNRYYLLEKECALWSSRIARMGFVPKRPATIEDVLEEFPLLEFTF